MAGDYENPRPETQEKINRIAADVMGGMKKGEALEASGYSKNNRKIMKAVKKTLAVHLEQIGLTSEELAIRIKAATEAEDTFFSTFRGQIVEERKIPDNKARNKALELAAEVMGHRPGREFNANSDTPVNINISFGGIQGATANARDAGFAVSLSPNQQNILAE